MREKKRKIYIVFVEKLFEILFIDASGRNWERKIWIDIDKVVNILRLSQNAEFKSMHTKKKLRREKKTTKITKLPLKTDKLKYICIFR